MKSLLGEAGFFQYLESFNKKPEQGLRLNTLKVPSDFDLSVLPIGEKIPWCKDAYYVNGGQPGLSPYHEAGLYYLQDPSAMSAVAVLSPLPGENILDLCAAPGGKSTQIAIAMQGKGILFSNEINPSRAQILSRNIERMGIQNAVVMNEHPEHLVSAFPSFFDRILVDAPCSGEGMFRKDPGAISEWDENAPSRCAERQLLILESAVKMLKDGGTLVYSTCTFNATENENVVSAFCRAHPEMHVSDFELPGAGISENGSLHLYPHVIRGEGHFLAKMVKEGSASSFSVKTTRSRIILPDFVPEVYKDYPLGQKKDLIFAWPKTLSADTEGALLKLKVLRQGLHLASQKGKTPEPDHALAMALTPDDYPHIDISEEDAVNYIKGEVLHTDSNCRGWVLICYHGISMGWGKCVDHVIKNHYPKGLRRR